MAIKDVAFSALKKLDGLIFTPHQPMLSRKKSSVFHNFSAYSASQPYPKVPSSPNMHRIQPLWAYSLV